MAEDKSNDPHADSVFLRMTSRTTPLRARRELYDVGDGIARRVAHGRVEEDEYPLLLTPEESSLPIKQKDYERFVRPAGFFHAARFDTLDKGEKESFEQLMTFNFNKQLQVIKYEAYGLADDDPPDRYVSVWWLDVFMQPDARMAAALRSMKGPEL